ARRHETLLPVVNPVAFTCVLRQHHAHLALGGADRLLARAGPQAGEHRRRVRRQPDVDAVPDALHRLTPAATATARGPARTRIAPPPASRRSAPGPPENPTASGRTAPNR